MTLHDLGEEISKEEARCKITDRHGHGCGSDIETTKQNELMFDEFIKRSKPGASLRVVRNPGYPLYGVVHIGIAMFAMVMNGAVVEEYIYWHR